MRCASGSHVVASAGVDVAWLVVATSTCCVALVGVVAKAVPLSMPMSACTEPSARARTSGGCVVAGVWVAVEPVVGVGAADGVIVGAWVIVL